MPRYFFHVFDGRSELDREGTELDNWDVARKHAIKRAGRILDDEAQRLGLGELWHMEVTDETGLSLFRLDFHVTMAPALLHKKAKEGFPRRRQGLDGAAWHGRTEAAIYLMQG